MRLRRVWMRLPSAATGRCMAGDLPALQGMFQGASEGARQNGVFSFFLHELCFNEYMSIKCSPSFMLWRQAVDRFVTTKQAEREQSEMGLEVGLSKLSGDARIAKCLLRSSVHLLAFRHLSCPLEKLLIVPFYIKMSF